MNSRPSWTKELQQTDVDAPLKKSPPGPHLRGPSEFETRLDNREAASRCGHSFEKEFVICDLETGTLVLNLEGEDARLVCLASEITDIEGVLVFLSKKIG